MEAWPLIESIEEACELLCPHGAHQIFYRAEALPKLEPGTPEAVEMGGHTFGKVDVVDVANSSEDRDVGFHLMLEDPDDEDADEKIKVASRAFTALYN